MNAFTERVGRGAALLDERRPDWWRLVDLDRLDIGSPCDCIAGQLYMGGGNYRNWTMVMDSLGLHAEADEAAHGFDGPGLTGDYTALTEAWRTLIARRREQAQVTA
jgi:hypothetical protein